MPQKWQGRIRILNSGLWIRGYGRNIYGSITLGTIIIYYGLTYCQRLRNVMELGGEHEVDEEDAEHQHKQQEEYRYKTGSPHLWNNHKLFIQFRTDTAATIQ
jgi:hypothetical protein